MWASRGIPEACEVDIYGTLSEYIGACITGDAITFYRHVLIQRRYPHHGAVAFARLRYFGIADIAYNQSSLPYPMENPWA